ncbi:pyrroloquinoline quinone biosynthesis peptide chaperone PqqD [Piscinibacter sp.]|jgi:pyrroloquinoline quinone biosynthesis protein D|uniref:pyrroloquinoline quinone biosynthesis peptide chaperone PqqD n=1 Tax=Piscinibacter sp. TaxID=1903157 RepID=UPI002F42B2B5
MNAVVRIESAPAIAPLYRLQYEAVQENWVLLYPEGMVKLNGPAGEILRRCDGQLTVQQLVSDLERSFGESDLGGDVCDFLSDAYGRGWII